MENISKDITSKRSKVRSTTQTAFGKSTLSIGLALMLSLAATTAQSTEIMMVKAVKISKDTAFGGADEIYFRTDKGSIRPGKKGYLRFKKNGSAWWDIWHYGKTGKLRGIPIGDAQVLEIWEDDDTSKDDFFGGVDLTASTGLGFVKKESRSCPALKDMLTFKNVNFRCVEFFKDKKARYRVYLR